MTNLPQYAVLSKVRAGTCPTKPLFYRRADFGLLLFLAVLIMTDVQKMQGQALPAAEAAPISTGFSLPRTAGTLNWGVSASENLTWGYYGNQGAAYGTDLTGDLGFISNSRLYPFSMVVSGGHSWANSGAPSASFVSLGLSQVVNVKRWNFLISDSLSYLPGTPTAGLSGVAGVGDLGAGPPGADTTQGVLTAYSDRISNGTTGSVQRQLTGKTSFNISGSYGIVRFVGNGSQGLGSSSVSGSAGLSHQINGRTSFGGSYSYSKPIYSANSLGMTPPGFTSQAASVQFSRQLTRKLGLTASAGPQWTSIDSAGSSQGTSFYAGSSLSYAGQSAHASLSYSRGTNSGFGVISGAISQSESISYGRTLARVWNFGATAAYSQASSLPAANAAYVSFDTTVASAQISRALMRSLSAYASYTFEHQPSGSSAAVDVFSGIEQVVGFGVTYSPSSIHVGSQ
jgi:hypothetical protein